MISVWERLRDRLLPGSIVTRMTLILFLGILVAQILGTLIWTRQIEGSERDRLIEVAQNMGARIGQTILFFSRLPENYRHIVLDQLRDMGGTRFFVSVNSLRIDLETIPQTELSQQVSDTLVKSISEQIGSRPGLTLDLVEFSQLRVFSGKNLMVELPPKWKRFALIDPGDDSPFVVIQLPVSDGEWLYLATVFPRGAVINQSLLSTERLLTLALVSFTVLLLTAALIRWVVRPLRQLARQADALGRGQNPDYIPEQGSTEMKTTIRTFNNMSQRIQKFIADRERLFASISHDLKTPLTRARLRAELIDSSEQRESLINDLDNLDALVKASLQMMKEGAIHENTTRVDLRKLLIRCLDSACVVDIPSTLDVPDSFVLDGRPLSLERLFTNLVDNAIHYGRSVEVVGWYEEDQKVIVQVRDRGPGLTDELKQRVFEPFFRVDRQPTSVHAGLGMGIVRSLAQLHGASIRLLDRPGGGLIVEVGFPTSQFVTH